MEDISTCLNNLIAVDRQCTAIVPTSGLFLQDLPGVTIRMADAGTDEETESGLALMEDKIAFAQRALVQDMRDFLLPKIRSASVIENDTVGFYLENLQGVASQAGQYKGIRAQISDFDYFSFYVQSVTVQLDASLATSVFIIDLLTNRILDTIAITTVANVPTEVQVNREYLSGKQQMSILVAIDAGVTGSFKNTLHPNARRGCTGCGAKWNAFIDFDSVRIPIAGQLIDQNTSGNNDGTNGVSINYSLNCIVDPVICNMSQQIAWGVLHKTGVELLKELKWSNRLNSYVTVNASKIDEMIDEFQAEYVKSINQITDNMNIPSNICYSCRNLVKKVSDIP